MKWNIKDCTGQVCKEFPDLHNIFYEFEQEEFQGIVTFDKIVRYIIFCYHKDSPFIKRQLEVGVRKERSLIEAGFTKEFPSEVLAILNNDNEVVVKMICQFLKFEKNMRYANLMFMYESYWNTTVAVGLYRTQMKDAATATKLTNEMTDLMNKIENEADKVFCGDIQLAEKVSANQVLEKRTPISPEQNNAAIRQERKMIRESQEKPKRGPKPKNKY